MSDFSVVEYESFQIEEDRRQPSARRSRPWVWGVVGLVVGLVIGLVLTYELPTPTSDPTAPLASPDVATNTVRPTPSVIAPAETLARASDGFVGEVQVFLETTTGTAHARILAQRAEPLVVDRDVDPASEPDRRGTNLARTALVDGTTRLEITSSLALGTGAPAWVGNHVSGWAWNRDRGETIAWSESAPDYPNATDIHHWTLGGPWNEPVTVGGGWQVVDYVGDTVVLVAEDQIGVLDLEFGQLYARTATAPVSVAGVHDGIVLGRAGPDDASVQIDLVGAYKTAPAWWQPAAGELVDDPGTGWAVQSYGDTAAVVDPTGATEHVVTTALPAWSANGNHLVIPQGSRLVIYDLRDGRRGAIDLGAPIVRVWVSG